MMLNTIDRKISNNNFDEDDNRNPEVTELCKLYVKDFLNNRPQKRSLFFNGKSKSGKTFYSSCIANELLWRANGVLCSDMRILIKKIEFSEESRLSFFNQVNTLDLIVIDELGEIEGELYLTDDMIAILKERFLSGKATIITSSVPLEKISRGIRNSRISAKFKSLCYPIQL